MDFKKKHKLFAKGFAEGPWHSQTNNIRFKFFANPIKNGITLGIFLGIVLGIIAAVGAAALFLPPPHSFIFEFLFPLYLIAIMIAGATGLATGIIVSGVFGVCCSIAMRSRTGFQKIKIEEA